jgi:hypothetical protein
VNSVISGNFSGAGGLVADDVSGADLLTANFSLIGQADDDLADGSGNNVFSTDPRLEPLGDYGGPTPTHLPMPTSPAVNGGSNALVPAGVTTDQRGRARVVGTVDMGATEAQTFRVANKAYRGRPGRALRVPAAKGLLAGVARRGARPMMVQLVVPPAARFGRLTLGEDGSFVFVPRNPAVKTVRFYARAFNGQEWSAPFRVTLTFATPTFGRRR